METNILDVTDPFSLGLELQRARKKVGLTQEEAAKYINVARTTLISIEKGERRIKASELLKLAQTYKRPLTDFVGARPQMDSFPVQFRGPALRSEADDNEIQPYIDALEDLCRNYLELEQIMQAPLNKKYPVEYSFRGLPLDEAAAGIASEERNRLGLGDGPLSNLRDILEQDIGIRVFYMEMPSRFSGMYVYNEQLGGCIAVNSKHPEERRRWTIAHDYAHFLTKRNEAFVSTDRRYQRIPESERFADSFAPCFLMPASGLRRRYNSIQQAKGKPTVGDLCTLAHYYEVSLEALTRRLEDMNLIPSGVADRLKQKGFKVQEAQKQLQLSERNVPAARLPFRYQQLALEAFQQERIGEEQFARFLGVDRLTARRIYAELQQDFSPETGEKVAANLVGVQA